MEKQILYSGRKKDIPVRIAPDDLTVPAIRKQLPDQYFHRSLIRSSAYLLRDIVQVVITVYIMYQYAIPLLDSILSIFSFLPSTPLLVIQCAAKFVLWNVYWVVQGLNYTGLWVMAHECGHQAFSPSRAINDTIGLILHSILLVPYHGWRISHRIHHKHTNHLTKEAVFVPATKPTVQEIASEAPLITVFHMILVFLVGWPLHLIVNASGQNYGRRTNHYEPSSPLFEPEDAIDILVSDAGIAVMLGVLGWCVYSFGLLPVFCWYFVPYLWVNFWLLFVTFLQHTDLRVPFYDAKHWTFTRGSLSTVDRDYGYILNGWLHHINDSHVIHHLFSQVPFYHAIQLTRKHCRELFGDLYVTDSRPLTTMLWESWRECAYVVPSEGICAFHSPS